MCHYDPNTKKLTIAKQKAFRQVGYEEAPRLVFRPYSENLKAQHVLASGSFEVGWADVRKAW